ncbi:kinetochore-associated protein DSN1 homolog isoform X2 [Denticeps clupeoides]|uniref:kinetochore-associated protein DSN1 homolog isoform X2 n=1 Tax=Denticeps clupeoides TaxID=299321 RepID=UPI0010A5181E|nr:kinetochore-associated protein DSN1 homolog isoform X2 [Denticeps clupeoides]
MAELQSEPSAAASNNYDDSLNKSLSERYQQGTKRRLSGGASPEPPQKSPRSSAASEDCQAVSFTAEGTVEVADPDAVPDVLPQKKSWRRSTRGRRSLPPLPSRTQNLCRDICLSLPEDERLEKLMEASMEFAVQEMRKTLHDVPGANLDIFQTSVESLHEEWGSLAQIIKNECQKSNTTSDPAVQKAIKITKNAMSSLQAESSSWESLLNKHRCKSEELEKRVEQARKHGVPLDPKYLAHSTQREFIQNKPDYHSILCRQQKVLQTMELVEQYELLVKEVSTRLASNAGFDDLPDSPVRKLLKGPRSSNTS